MSMNPWWAREINGIQVNRPVFIETGSKRGGTITQAVGWDIPIIHSIDIVWINFNYCAVLFRHTDGVHLHHGDSRELLPVIIDPEKPTTFYLDAHYEGDGNFIEGDTECPVLQELKIIVAAPWKVKPVVIVDDIHLFYNPWSDDIVKRFNADDWPDINELHEVLKGYTYLEDAGDRSGIWT